MTLPRKRTRRIVIDGIGYLWNMGKTSKPKYRGYPTRETCDSKSKATSTITFQLDETRPGNICQVVLSWNYDIWGSNGVSSVTPEAISIIIRQALDSGWDPRKRGSVYKMPPIDFNTLNVKENREKIARLVIES